MDRNEVLRLFPTQPAHREPVMFPCSAEDFEPPSRDPLTAALDEAAAACDTAAAAFARLSELLRAAGR